MIESHFYIDPQSMYHNRSESVGVAKALLNVKDPRTFPRYAVALTAACFFSIATANSYWYKRHHFQTEHKNDPHAATHCERPNQMVRTVSSGPIAMNAKRYGTLRHYGLGVDKNHKD